MLHQSYGFVVFHIHVENMHARCKNWPLKTATIGLYSLYSITLKKDTAIENSRLTLVSLSLRKPYIIIIVCIGDIRSDLKMLIYRTAIPP